MTGSRVSHRIVCDLLRARTGQQLLESRSWRIDTALSGTFRKHGIANVEQLVCLLAEPGSDDLAREVVEALLNNETYFFRDRQMFDLLERDVLPEIAERRKLGKRLRIWSAGCSTGQEVYSLAMIFASAPEIWGDWDIRIVGTDVSQRAIKYAEKACYSQFEIQRGLTITQMLEWFDEAGSRWRPKERLRRMVRFEHGSILEPTANRQNFDLILCRNVLLYFDAATREQAFECLDTSLANDGWLMIGAGETIVGRTGKFAPVGRNQGLCRRAASPAVSQGSKRARVRVNDGLMVP